MSKDDAPCIYKAVPKCGWSETPDGPWDTSCSYSFEGDGPLESGFSYCPYCGKQLEAEPYQEEDDV